MIHPVTTPGGKAARWHVASAFVALIIFGQRLAFAQDALIPPPKFSIERFEIIGDRILGDEAVQRAVRPFIGQGKDFGDVQRALEALEAAYRARGFGVVQVLLPEQDITRGVVRFDINAPRLGRVRTDGNKHFSDDNLRRTIPALRTGETPNSAEIARNLQLVTEHPVKQTNVLLRSGSTEGEVDATIRVTDDKPWRLLFTLDDSGNSSTGYLRSGIGFQHTNLFGLDHQLSLQYQTSPTHIDRVEIYGLGYRIPFYSLHSALDIVAGYSDVNSGVVQGLFNVSGSGAIFGVKWSYYLPKWGDLGHKAYAGFDYRAFQNRVVFGNVGIVPDVTVHPVSLGYGGVLQAAASQWNFNVSVATNLPGGSDGRSADFRRSRASATENYTVFRALTAYSLAFKSDWQARASVNAQFTRDSLVSGESFGAGGPDSVRGYQAREASDDKGYATQLELYTPELAGKLGLADTWKARLLGFYDFGQVSRNNPSAGESHGKFISSTGIGLRMTQGKSFSFRVDLAQILQAHGTRQVNEQRVNASMAYIY